MSTVPKAKLRKEDNTGKNQGNNNTIHITPITLNKKCTRDAVLASLFAIKDAIKAVVVVPIFSPKISEAAISSGSQPCAHMVKVTAMATLDDRTIAMIVL